MTLRFTDNRDMTQQDDYLRARIETLRAEVQRLAAENAELKRLLAEYAAKSIISEY